MSAARHERVVILGLGGGAGKIVRALADTRAADWATLVYLDTDAQDLDFVAGVLQLPMGSNRTRGQGCGGDPDIGETATDDSAAAIREAIHGADLLVVVACLGGGAASGGVQALARLVSEGNLPTFFFVTLPFAYEGNKRRSVAERSLEALRQRADVVIAVPNDLLFTSFPAATPAPEAFARANELLARGLASVGELVRGRGLLPVDFASLRTHLRRQSALCALGVGTATGPDRLIAVADAALASPMLGGRDRVRQADVVIATLNGPDDLPMGDLNTCLAALHQQLGEGPRTVVGATLVPRPQGDLTLTLLAIHYQTAAGRQPEPAPAPTTGRPPRKSKPRDDDRQIALPLVDEGLALGIFANVPPTNWRGENLDIPTYLRRGINLDTLA